MTGSPQGQTFTRYCLKGTIQGFTSLSNQDMKTIHSHHRPRDEQLEIAK